MRSSWGHFGLPITFAVDIEPTTATYVRLVAERHPGWFAHPALKHARGFLLDSWIEITRT